MEYLHIHINKYIDCMISNSNDCDALATGLNRESSEENIMHRNSYKKTFPVLHHKDLRAHYD